MTSDLEQRYPQSCAIGDDSYQLEIEETLIGHVYILRNRYDFSFICRFYYK